MDKNRHKSKKESPHKGMENRSPSFITDVKSIKENLRIKEILRTVKMNSSMRIKSQKGCKVMRNKDFTEDTFEDTPSGDMQKSEELPNDAINSDVNIVFNTGNESEALNDNVIVKSEEDKNYLSSIDAQSTQEIENVTINNTASSEIKEPNESINDDLVESNAAETEEKTEVKEGLDNARPQSLRNRKLSLDHTLLLNRVGGLSQSEIDLNLMGKSPLERKSSFFRKKMDSFFKNTQEIFKKRSQSTNTYNFNRKGSISVSLQSLNENAIIDSPPIEYFTQDSLEGPQDAIEGSVTSSQSRSTMGNSMSSLSNTADQIARDTSDQESQTGSQPTLSTSQPFTAISSNHLNDACHPELLLNARAISMNTGLDTATGQRRLKKSRSKRVTWVASEGLTNYLRRLTQDENNKGVHACYSYQDFLNIPEAETYTPKLDSKGRRLSYQRAVSGEDPVHHLKNQDSMLRRRVTASDSSKASNIELSNKLAEFSRNGVPPLQKYKFANISDEAFEYLKWVEDESNLETFFDWKTLSSNDEARQAVIRELILTEANYIKHLIALVEVFFATFHAIQSFGKLLDLRTEKLFSNIPEVLNASLQFWDVTIYPMLADAVENGKPFNTELMAPGFYRFREIFQPYERFLTEQKMILDYLRSLSANTEFMTYLNWCHGQKACNRLQLSDILVKPMQRLTKYRLILHRITAHTETEQERRSLVAMEKFSKSYVVDLNRFLRQRDELDKLDDLSNSIDPYDIDFKDDELDYYFHMYLSLNLKAPMLNCLPTNSRTLIYEGDARYKDKTKEMDVRIILLTDMMLVCKKNSKGSPYLYKLIRPKFMVDRMAIFPKYNVRKELVSIVIVMLDAVGSAYQAFTLSELTKDPTVQASFRAWEYKIREAKLTYDLSVWFAKNPERDLSDLEIDSSSDQPTNSTSNKASMRHSPDDVHIEREARERVATMLHRNMGASTDYDVSQGSMATDSLEVGEISCVTGTSGARTPAGVHSLRYPMYRTSTGGSSRNSRLSSFQQSSSAASHDEPQPGPSKPNFKITKSVDHIVPPLSQTEAVTSITVHVVSETESESASVTTPHLVTSSRSSRNTLHVQPPSGLMPLVHSLPDLTIEPSTPRDSQSPNIQSSASDRVYTSQQELLQKNRLAATQYHQYLSPNQRGTSYPPPSPTRASLQRGMAFSYSFKYPPLSKMERVNSQTQLQTDAGSSTGEQDIAKDDEIITAPPEPSTSAGPHSKGKKTNKSGSPTSPPKKENKSG